jgi:transcriptional regulator with GAF, ATPase, and Fis domain
MTGESAETPAYARAFGEPAEARRGSDARSDARPDTRMVGRSAARAHLERWIEVVAPLDTTVLLTGETGTGKGVVARLLHERSPRSDRAWVHVDCGALAPSLVESELFGHERGSFTGAYRTRRGRLEAAAGGTLFLDEVGELDLPLQAKLLRALQDRVFDPVGTSSPRALRARVVAATNRDLAQEIRAGRFRRDLFYRLHVAHCELPPLRERLEDLPALIDEWLRRIAARRRAPVPRPSRAALAELAAYSWPGNVRELGNVLEQWLIQLALGRPEVGCITELLGASAVGHVGAGAPRPSEPTGPERQGELCERERLRAALAATGGNVARTARRLAIPRSTLRYRLQRYQLGVRPTRD